MQLVIVDRLAEHVDSAKSHARNETRQQYLGVGPATTS
jgi:hypothetical protein